MNLNKLQLKKEKLNWIKGQGFSLLFIWLPQSAKQGSQILLRKPYYVKCMLNYNGVRRLL